MFKERILVRLISSGSSTFNTNFHEQLVRVGYKDIKLFHTNDVIDDSNIAQSQQIFILPLIDATNTKKKLSAIGKLIKNNPVLGIVKESSFDLEEQYLKTCNDVIYWPCSDDEFAYRMQRICDLHKHTEYLSCDNDMSEGLTSMNLIGRSPPFFNVLKNIKKISRYDVPVLIEGETGTGKELAARAIHYLGPRKDFPFIPVNCGAIPDNLIENELFGHEKGAYTDAKHSQEGIIGLANHGTIFLDEVEAFSPKGQVVLLRFLQDLLYRPLGSVYTSLANVRIIAASNEKLSRLVERGLFRQDLFYRLNILSIEMPSLSRRGEDIGLLAEYFFNKFKLQYNQPDKFLHPDSFHWMKRYSWPGNVRELENLLHREFLLAEGPCVELRKKPITRKERRVNSIDRRAYHIFQSNFNEAKSTIITQFEKTYLTHLLRATDGNVTLAAKTAGKERRALGKLLKKHGISKDS